MSRVSRNPEECALQQERMQIEAARVMDQWLFKNNIPHEEREMDYFVESICRGTQEGKREKEKKMYFSGYLAGIPMPSVGCLGSWRVRNTYVHRYM